jgi:hypothetical protein
MAAILPKKLRRVSISMKRFSFADKPLLGTKEQVRRVSRQGNTPSILKRDAEDVIGQMGY